MTICDPEILDKLDELIKIVWSYLTVDEKGEKVVREDSPEHVKQAYQEYLDINDSFKIQS